MRRSLVLNRLFVLVSAIPILASPNWAAADTDLDTAASHFGRTPAVWGMRLSPNGLKVSFLKLHPEGMPIAMVVDLATGKGNLVLASDAKKGVDIVGCEWANDTRLLCEYFGIWKLRGDVLPATRLVAVDIDGKNSEVLTQRQLARDDEFATNQSEIVDRLPEDSKHIWLQLRKGSGIGVSRVDIYKNHLKTIERPQQSIWGYQSDGRGEIRFRTNWARSWVDDEYRLAGDSRWRKLRRYRPNDEHNIYQVAAIEPGSNEILVWDWYEGRRSLFREWLVEDASADRKRELVDAHKQVDLSWILRVGQFRRAVGVAYRTDKLHVEYFDAQIKKVDRIVKQELPGRNVFYLDESLGGRFYLIHASSDVDPGAYYRFDVTEGVLSRVSATFPWLEGVELAEMQPIEYPGTGETSVPGYLTQPPDAKGPVPLIVFPHGGPSSRDDWGFDLLPQFFAARGYAVLQANYRGSDGYGKDWLGEGGFKGWEKVVSDIDAGVQHLIDKGIADPERICTVGWSFGGYAALISAIEKPDRYRCAVSVAGVTHPYQLLSEVWRHNRLERRFLKSILPTKGDEIVQGSPLRRASEMPVPVLLFHGDRDLNVDVAHSRNFERDLRHEQKSVNYVEYEGADHSIRREADRIDMLQRMGEFLDQHLAVKANVSSAAKE